MIKEHSIVEGLISTEAVVIDSIRPMGKELFRVKFTGVNSHMQQENFINAEQYNKLKVIATEDEFDFSGDAHKFKLFAEAERINTAYQFDPLFAINCSVVDALPHQVEAVYKFLLPQPRIRFLLADDTGAGKTIMTGLLLKELLMRHSIDRILIVTPGGLTRQWVEDELYTRFNLQFKLVNRNILQSEPTVFQNEKRIVASIDFICQDNVLAMLETTHWDMVIFDEAHKLSAYQYGQRIYHSQRYKAALTISQICQHILLLTATPHRGREDTFMMLMKLLDSDIFATTDLATDRVRDVSNDGINKFFIRRLKEDMKDWDGNPLYMPRHTRTVSYELTDDEKRLYDAVTQYLTVRKEEAQESRNMQVTLALQVMQRRLVSSIYAIRNTLRNRYNALKSLSDALKQNPSLWSHRVILDNFDNITIDDFDELDDIERDELDNIMQDPRKFRLFTTAKSPKDIEAETQELKALADMADKLYQQHVEERKYIKLKELLLTQNIINGEKLVIFTEHKDTLFYLADRLSNNGYTVATIHGGLNVDERRQAQEQFKTPQTQILICTDAAGEGINLQFCQLLINWDIPWNPNRLEQRMGRIHRYGQKHDVIVFNMVADNTREGQVLKTLLHKLDIIREQLGDDRVYDVIQDVFKDVQLNDIIESVFNGKHNSLDQFLAQDNQQLGNLFQQKITQQNNQIAHSTVNYHEAHRLKEESDERRLQPIYIRQFFEDAFQFLGGKTTAIDRDIFQITHIPDIITQRLLTDYNINADSLTKLKFFFDKHQYNEYILSNAQHGSAYYINPGNQLFDTLINVVCDEFRTAALQGTLLASPTDPEPFYAFFVKDTITNDKLDGHSDIVNQQLTLVCLDHNGQFTATSPAKLLDLAAPQDIDLNVDAPQPCNKQIADDWVFENITAPLFETTKENIEKDIDERRQYLKDAFLEVILNFQKKINDLQAKIFINDSNTRNAEKINTLELQLRDIEQRREARLRDLDKEYSLAIKAPQFLGCAYVVPLPKDHKNNHINMHRDDEVERIAMQYVMQYELRNGRQPTDVSDKNTGYDIRSVAPDGNSRFIEVKGRAHTDGVMLSNNEMHRLEQLGNKAYLYVVLDCKTQPRLLVYRDPAHNLAFKPIIKSIEYYLTPDNLIEPSEKIIS